MAMLTEAHARLKANLASVCRTANVPQHMLEESAAKYCTGPELDYLRKFPRWQREGRGIVLAGIHVPGADTKFQAMAAALLRNFIDARVMTVQTLLDAHEADGYFPDPTVLLIPNLHVVSTGKVLTAWQTQLVYDLFLQRQVMGKITFAYVESMDKFTHAYGQIFKQHLTDNFEIVWGSGG